MQNLCRLLIASVAAFVFMGLFVDDSEKQMAHRFSERAIIFFDDGRYDSALFYYQKADKIYSKYTNWIELADCKNSIAEVYRLLSDTEHALTTIDAVIALCNTHFSGNSETLAKAYEIKGKVYDYTVRDFETANQYYEKSFSIRKALYGKEHPAIAENYFLLGRIFLNTGKFSEAGTYFKTAEKMKNKLLGASSMALYDLYFNEATLNRRLLRFDSALYYYKVAQTICVKNHRKDDHPNFGLLAYGMGNLYIEQGLYDDAIRAYKSALKVFLKCYGENDFHIPTTYSNIGAAYSNELDYDAAEQFYNKALAIYKIILEEDHPFISSLYVDFCDLYFSAGKFEESIRSGRKAIALLQHRYHDEPTRELGIACFYTGNSLLQAEKFQEALPLINTSINVFKGMGETYLLSNAYATRGSVYDALNSFDLAEKDFIQATTIFGTNAKNLHLAYSYRAFASHAGALKKFDKALELSNKGLTQLGIVFRDPCDLPSLDSLYTVDYLSELLPVRGAALVGIYGTTHQKKYLLAALKNYEALTGVYRKIIQENKAERSKLLQLPNLVAFYEKAVECALELYRLTQDNDYQRRAFAFAEQSKAILLLQYVHDTKARQFAGIPETILHEEREHKENISHLESLLAERSENDSMFSVLQKNLFNAKIAYTNFLDNLEKNYRSYYTLKYQHETINTTELMKGLSPKEGIVEYLIGEENIYLFLMSAKEMDIITLIKDPGCEQHAVSLRESLLERNLEKYIEHASALYRIMVEPAEKFLQRNQISSVTIIPDGFMSYVPVESLLKKNNGSKTSRYLLEDYTIHYQYSASLIAAYRTRHDNLKNDFVGFAPSFSSTRDGLTNLAYNKIEVASIREQIGGDEFAGEQASEANFKKLAGEYNIIHLATHAVLDDDHADLSRLYFSTEVDSLEDGKLFAHELFTMRITAQLITLSACNTGMGKFHKGEGVMSLSRAFAYAGCPSIVTSLWDAQDKSTSVLMDFFYENLSTGMAKDESLRQAKLRYLHASDKVKSNPFFWAGFILVGDEKPVEKMNNDVLWMIILGALLLGGVGYWYKVKS